MKIQYQRGPRNRRCLVHFAVQHAGAGRGAPVNPIERIARLVAPHSGNSGGIFIQPVLQANFANRPTRGDFVA